MYKLSVIAALTAATLFTTTANADQERWPRWYVGLSGGVTFLGDTDLSGGTTGNLDYDMGGIGTLSLGYMPPLTMQPLSNMRIEAELGYHYNQTDSLVLAGTPTATDGYIRAISYMGNLYYDLRNMSRWTPYFGAGAGGAQLTLSRGSNVGNTDTTDTVFAWQLMAGLGYSPVTMPMTEWTLGYRYFVAQSPEFGDIELDDYTAHNVEIGGKFRF
jgi:opacity protein-like surface antigen